MDVVSQSGIPASAPPLAAYGDPGTVAQVVAAPSVAPAAVAAPAAPAGSTGRPAESERLPSAVRSVFAGSASDVSVSLRVAHDPNEIVTVFRDAATGQVINQVPNEAIILLAEFFQQEASGALLDKDA